MDFACEIDPVQKSAEVGKKRIQEKTSEDKIVGILPTQYNNDVWIFYCAIIINLCSMVELKWQQKHIQI